MTLIKSTLLGSAAGIVAVAGAQAADLPTHKAAPVVQYVRICNVGGITGWTLPGSDTCVKLSRLHHRAVHRRQSVDPVQLGELIRRRRQRDRAHESGAGGHCSLGLDAASGGAATQRVLIAGSDVAGEQRPSIVTRLGWTTRANFGFDFASNTAYGPLIGHFDINANWATASTTPAPATYLNTGYLTWAGITAGKAQSFYLVRRRRRQLGELLLPRPQGLQRA